MRRTRRRAGGRQFKKGQSGNPAGRPKGALNRANALAKKICQGLTTGDKTYLKNLRKRMRDGTVHGTVETMIWYMGHGRPRFLDDEGNDSDIQDIAQEVLAGLPADRRRALHKAALEAEAMGGGR